MDCVNGLLDNARLLMETAASSVQAGLGDCDWTVFIGPQGGLQMIAGREQSIESLTWSHGATSAWQISRQGERVRVEGRGGDERCLLESTARDGAMRRVLSEVRLYEVAAA